MASGINKLMNFLKLTDEDDEFDDDFYDDDDLYDQRELEREEKRLQREQKKQERRSPVAATPRSNVDYFDEEPPVQATPKRNTYRTTSTGKVVQMPSSATSTEMEVCIVKPANIGESQQVCELLINSHPVIVNLEGIDIMEAQRIMDFIAGCIFAISGNMCQISRYIFIFSPKGVDISGDYLKSLTEEESFNMANFHREF